MKSRVQCAILSATARPGSPTVADGAVSVTRRLIAGAAGRASLCGLLLLAATASCAGGQEPPPRVALVEFSYSDTSGETRDQADEHRVWLQMFSAVLRTEIAKGPVQLAQWKCVDPACAVTDGLASDVLVSEAEDTGVRYLITGGIHKMSTLVQWARLVILDLEGKKVVADRLFSFRGDTEQAWRRAALNVGGFLRDLGPELSRPAGEPSVLGR